MFILSNNHDNHYDNDGYDDNDDNKKNSGFLNLLFAKLA